MLQSVKKIGIEGAKIGLISLAGYGAAYGINAARGVLLLNPAHTALALLGIMLAEKTLKPICIKVSLKHMPIWTYTLATLTTLKVMQYAGLVATTTPVAVPLYVAAGVLSLAALVARRNFHATPSIPLKKVKESQPTPATATAEPSTDPKKWPSKIVLLKALEMEVNNADDKSLTFRKMRLVISEAEHSLIQKWRDIQTDSTIEFESNEQKKAAIIKIIDEIFSKFNLILASPDVGLHIAVYAHSDTFCIYHDEEIVISVAPKKDKPIHSKLPQKGVNK